MEKRIREFEIFEKAKYKSDCERSRRDRDVLSHRIRKLNRNDKSIIPRDDLESGVLVSNKNIPYESQHIKRKENDMGLRQHEIASSKLLQSVLSQFMSLGTSPTTSNQEIANPVSTPSSNLSPSAKNLKFEKPKINSNFKNNSTSTSYAFGMENSN